MACIGMEPYSRCRGGVKASKKCMRIILTSYSNDLPGRRAPVQYPGLDGGNWRDDRFLEGNFDQTMKMRYVSLEL